MASILKSFDIYWQRNCSLAASVKSQTSYARWPRTERKGAGLLDGRGWFRLREQIKRKRRTDKFDKRNNRNIWLASYVHELCPSRCHELHESKLQLVSLIDLKFYAFYTILRIFPLMYTGPVSGYWPRPWCGVRPSRPRPAPWRDTQTRHRPQRWCRQCVAGPSPVGCTCGRWRRGGGGGWSA